MNTLKSIYCRHIIAQPNYYRDRALAESEAVGGLFVDLALEGQTWREIQARRREYWRHLFRRQWYIRKTIEKCQTLTH